MPVFYFCHKMAKMKGVTMNRHVIRWRACACVRVCVRAREFMLSGGVCVCVCVCVRESEEGREREKKEEREQE